MDQAIEDNTLNPLAWFYRAAGAAGPALEPVEADALPDPYRRLLAHDRDMTSTLESFIGQRLSLRVLNSRLEADWLHREVVLEGDDDGMMAEFGAIRICVGRLTSAAARSDIRDGRRPLGGILADHGIAHRCHSGGYFRLRCDETMRSVFGMTDEPMLYGRHNRLFVDEELLAEVTEILPDGLEERSE